VNIVVYCQGWRNMQIRTPRAGLPYLVSRAFLIHIGTAVASYTSRISADLIAPL
jgi:hypothetical protein